MNVTPFNGPWWALIGALTALGFAIHFALRDRPRAVRKGWLVIVALANLGASITFHIAYLTDADVNFPWAQNLPLHLCTIMSWLMPLTVALEWRPLRTVAFFPGALAGLLALYSAAPMYHNHALFSAHTFFWVAHAMNAVIPFLLASLGLYEPRMVDAPLSVVYAVALALLVLPVTLALRAWVDPGANYFFVFDPEGAEILQLFYRWIGMPIVYLLPLLVAILPVLFAQVGVYRLATRARRRPVAAA